jgi:putative ABC transport system substrate-binding protein
MKRRGFIALVGAAVIWPLGAAAQQSDVRVVGFLTSLGQNDSPNLRDAFRRGMGETGYVEGRNVAIEYGFAENQIDRLPTLATDLVRRKVAVMAATGGGASVLAAKASTITIPIVFTTGGDPVREGFVTSLNRPGGNITGVSWFATLVGGKALELLHEFMPNADVIALMVNPKLPEASRTIIDVQAAARVLNRRLVILNASSPSEIDAVFATFRQRGIHALLVVADPFFTSRRQQIVSLAARDAIPAMYLNRQFISEGGLMSYGNDVVDAYRRAGVYVGRILNGASPSELPIDQATKFEFVINRKTANALKLEIPPKFLFSADEVIE